MTTTQFRRRGKVVYTRRCTHPDSQLKSPRGPWETIWERELKTREMARRVYKEMLKDWSVGF
jgi:hypothetical protein